MERIELGERLCQWHSSQADPVYAVGSFYFSDKRYPDKGIVEDALHNLSKDLEEAETMLRGEKVRRYNTYYGRWVEDQRAFAGFTDEDLRERIEDLTEIVWELNRFLREDYPASEEASHA